MRLHELGEDRLLEQLTRRLRLNRKVLAGAGDDCAVTRFDDAGNCLVLKTDCIVERVHFTSDAKAHEVGWKAMARPLSDFAGMSAVPEFALVTLIVPAETTVLWATELYRGLEKAASAFDVAIVGGETSGTAGALAISVTIAGSVEPERWVSRGGGKRDDELFVTGRLGGSLRGGHLRFTPRLLEARWLTEHFPIRAMMDLSDGLGADLPRLARASRVGFQIDEHLLPRNRGCSIEQAISDGEDYELLFAIPPAASEQLARKWRKRFPRLPLTRIGQLTAAPKRGRQPLPRGYVHFE